MISLSVVIPVFNNSLTIPILVEEIHGVVTTMSIDYEIVLVNDGSTDNSVHIIDEIKKDNKNVIFLNLNKNIGQQRAIIKGLEIAKGRKIVVMDADLQDNPKLILELYNKLTEDLDSIFVRRIGSYQSSMRMFTSRVLKTIIQLIIGLNKNAGSYFIINKSLVSRIEELNSKYFYATIMVCTVSKNVGYIDAERNKSKTSSSYNTVKRMKSGFKAIICAIECRRSLY